MNVQIRSAEPEDAAEIVAVLNPIILAGCYTSLDRPFELDEEHRFIAGFPKRGIFHVAEGEGSRIVGVQTVEPFATYTAAFDHVGVIGTYVALDHRREGVGSQLFAATIQAAHGKGYEKLFSFIRADNPAALAAYRKQGFEVIGIARQHAKIQGRYVDELMIEKLLLS
ncbi:MAG: GNAT family N-acetyltransferase [Bryobacteraceae bacterium]|nr:GNAT family N-acetyltransferase [Bryobacteraceae bacterium]